MLWTQLFFLLHRVRNILPPPKYDEATPRGRKDFEYPMWSTSLAQYIRWEWRSLRYSLVLMGGLWPRHVKSVQLWKCRIIWRGQLASEWSTPLAFVVWGPLLFQRVSSCRFQLVFTSLFWKQNTFPEMDKMVDYFTIITRLAKRTESSRVFSLFLSDSEGRFGNNMWCH